MSANIHVIPKEDWEVLRKYFEFDGNEGVVLIPEHIYDGLSQEVKTAVDEGYVNGYDFGGEADASVDFVLSSSHMFVKNIEENAESQDDEEGVRDEQAAR